jgi:chloride channel protein, CIC family
MSQKKRFLGHQKLRKYTALVRADLVETYSRNLHKWLLIAPLIGVATGLLTTGIAVVILDLLWPRLLGYFLQHHWAILPGLLTGFILTGLIMQHFTPDPNEHSTEEIIRSYHERRGSINMRLFFAKLAAAATTVGFGGSAALEGPSIYGGGAIGSWLWEHVRGLTRLTPRDRRIMLISGAAAGMAAVFRAPLTGLVFALEMPYKDDLAHEALLPSLIASVVSYMTLISFLGPAPLFDFGGGSSYSRVDLLLAAVLGLGIGTVAMVFGLAFRCARTFIVKLSIPHWTKLAAGGLLTGICGLVFVSIFPGPLIPIGPNYEAVENILTRFHSSGELLAFGAIKLTATLATLASGGVSAMFVPLFLVGGTFGTAFAQVIGRHSSLDLYAAVGMAAFLAGGYKTPLAAVVFVAEATGGHGYIIPALIGAAVAYGVSGEASVSGDQRLHETARLQEHANIPVGEIMQRQVVAVQPESTLLELSQKLAGGSVYTTYPVIDHETVVGIVSLQSLVHVPIAKWHIARVYEAMDRQVEKIPVATDVMEALRLLSNNGRQMLLVVSPTGTLMGVVTKSDILGTFEKRNSKHRVEAALPLQEASN